MQSCIMKDMSDDPKKTHTASDFNLDILSGDTDLFRWFLLCYLFGKPIQSARAVSTWRLLLEKSLDTPWAIAGLSEYTIDHTLQQGGYSRYQHVTAHGLRVCMNQLINSYEGSLSQMLENSQDQDEFTKRLQQLYGVGPKITEIFMTSVDEFFARRTD